LESLQLVFSRDFDVLQLPERVVKIAESTCVSRRCVTPTTLALSRVVHRVVNDGKQDVYDAGKHTQRVVIVVVRGALAAAGTRTAGIIVTFV
jgi:hypothetical protein